MDIRQSTAAGAARPRDILVPPTRAPEPAPAPAPLEPAFRLDLSEEARTDPATDPAARPPAEAAERHFVRDPDSKALVYQVVDPVSGEVYAQLPDEATLRARMYARELEARSDAGPRASVLAVA